MKDVMVLKYGNNKQQEVANLFMEKVRLYAKTTDTKEEL